MQLRPRIALIAALARNRVIGQGNRMPWHLPEDLRHFKRLTSGHAVVMGRRTFASIGRALPNRTNIVVTRDAAFAAEGVRVAHSLDEALAMAPGDDVVFVIGGGELYEQTLDRADVLHLTEIDAEIDGDTRFPAFDRTQFREVSRESSRDPASGLAYDFVTYERVG